jgi:hypothetical protein
MTSTERLYSLFSAVHFVVRAGVVGDFVECGVWKGGSVMMMALILKSLGLLDRYIYLFDTFEGMTAPTAEDVEDQSGRLANDLLAARHENVLARSSIDDVRSNLEKIGYPIERFVFVQGDVCKTIPACSPERISLLRLDTDWYESTRHELENLFPRLSDRGVLIVDDYGHWRGARKAVDEYFSDRPIRYLMHRIDYTGRILLKA